MKQHVKVYLQYFDLGEQDVITCEGCLKQGRVDGEGFDIHHVKGRIGKETNSIRNLMCLCRKCHTRAHNDISKGSMQYVHNNFLQGRRKPFLK